MLDGSEVSFINPNIIVGTHVMGMLLLFTAII